MIMLTPRTGATRRGQPVSLNRRPSPDLERYIARLFVTIVEQPDDQYVDDFLLNEKSFVRVLVRGRWEARSAERTWRHYDGPIAFGAQSRRFDVRVRGSLAVAGFAIRPAAWPILFGSAARTLADRIMPIDGAWGDRLAAAAAQIDDHDATFAAIEAAARHRIAQAIRPIDPTMEKFERLAIGDPVQTVGAIADRLGIDERTLHRRALRCFGHSPKIVLRRARFLDMAAVLRGLAVPDADALAELRFYDQSHLSHEFKLFTGMTPAVFERTDTPLLTLGIEARQREKNERVVPSSDPAPWLA